MENKETVAEEAKETEACAENAENKTLTKEEELLLEIDHAKLSNYGNIRRTRVLIFSRSIAK